MNNNNIDNKKMILYLYKQEKELLLSEIFSNNLHKVLSAYYKVVSHCIGDISDNTIVNRKWNLVILQGDPRDEEVEFFLHKLKKIPLLYISTHQDIRGYIVPCENLFSIIDINNGDLSTFGVPEEIILKLKNKIEKTSDCYLPTHNSDCYRIIYCPTEYSAKENILKLLSSLRRMNVALTIVSDMYLPIQSALPTFVKVVSRDSLISIFEKGHLVIGSGYDAICAMALCKPCVILGDYGLGGFITPENYSNLNEHYFNGRKGAHWGESVPVDLLEIEIKNALSNNCRDIVSKVKDLIIISYNAENFDLVIHNEIERILKLSEAIKDKVKRKTLIPILSSQLFVKNVGENKYIMRGMNCYGKIDEEMEKLLKQCNGVSTISDIINCNSYKQKDAVTLWTNLHELWKEKLILFKS